MRILVLDYITVRGHRNFNSIHVKCLERGGHYLDVVGREEAVADIAPSEHVHITTLPAWAYRAYPLTCLSERLKQVAVLRWIKRKFKVASYDLVVLLAYDILSLSLFIPSQSTIVINHNNVAQLKSKVKRFLTLHLSKRYTHIVLTKDSEDVLGSLIGRDRVKFMPHGFVDNIKEGQRPDYLLQNEWFLFFPTNANNDYTLVKNVLNNNETIDYIEDKKIRIIGRKDLLEGVKGGHIVKLEGRIPAQEYNYLLQNALAVVLPYSCDFKYRCSGMLFECIAAGTPVIASDIEAMRQYRGKMPIWLFKDNVEFMKGIDGCLAQPVGKYDKMIYFPDRYWEEILSK